LLQQWYGLSDLDTEKQISDRISFMKFLGFPDSIPDSRTIWLFRERMSQARKDELVWDGTWAKKGDKLHFGYKLHSKVDIDYGLIRSIESTTASVHDSRVDLSVEGEVVLRDKGYFGVPAKGNDFTMKRATAGHPLNDLDQLRNHLISKLRSPGERQFAVIKRVFRCAHVMVTTIPRVHVKMVFAAFAFNLYQLCTLKNAGIVSK